MHHRNSTPTPADISTSTKRSSRVVVEDLPYTDYDSEEQAHDEIRYALSVASKELHKGNLGPGERILLSCYTACMDLGKAFDPYRLVIAIRLGDLYYEHEAWIKAIGQYRVAYLIWDADEKIAESEAALHPVSFLPKVAECYERAGSKVASKMKVKADQFVALYSESCRNEDQEDQR